MSTYLNAVAKSGVREHRSVKGSSNAYKIWLLDVSSGIEEFSEGCGDQIDHGYEGVDIAVAPGPSSCGLEDTVEGLDAGIVVV